MKARGLRHARMHVRMHGQTQTLDYFIYAIFLRMKKTFIYLFEKLHKFGAKNFK